MDRAGPVSRAGDGLMRALLFEAAQCLFLRGKRELPLRAWAEALAARIGRKKALVALARKLAVILHAMLIHGRAFDDQIQAAAAVA